jgi:hypothetical protein
MVRWHRTGKWLTDGERLLIWEYPRQAPDGDQVDLVEVMEKTPMAISQGFLDALVSPRRAPERADADDIFEFLIGSWDLEAVLHFR